MRPSLWVILLAIFFRARLTACKNILAVFPHFGKSHFVMYEPYLEKLAERGHSVTLVTWSNATHLNHPNVNVIGFGDEEVPFKLDLAEYDSVPRFMAGLAELRMLNHYGQKVCSLGLSDPKIKELVKSKRHFDLVVMEFFNTDCFAVFSHIFNAPLVGMFSSAPMPWHNDRMANPDNPSYIVNMFSGYRSEMNFFTRLKNTANLLFGKAYYKFFYSGRTDKIVRANLGKGIPKVTEIVFNTSLFLVNSHFSIFQPRPLVPGVVEVGGMHLREPKKLPADLEKYLTGSRNGVVYFSLGTVTKGSSLQEKKRKAIANAFGNLTQNVLWIRDSEEMPDKPKNVLIKKWVPQNDLLAHPNIKVFVTHGGLMGLLEAISHGVPAIVIPLFGDQFYNAALLAEKGSAIVLDYSSLTERKFTKALKDVLEDKRYKENAKLLAARFKERPLSPMNSAIYWTEYVMKFKGAHHLRPASSKLSWFSEYLLDLIAFFLLLSFLIVHYGRKAFFKWRETRRKAQSEQIKKKK